MTMVWATRRKNNIAAHISEVPSGLACDCICPGCSATLEAVNSENPFWKKRPHFRHYNAPELSDCETKAVMKAAKETFSKGNKFLTPEKMVSVTVRSKSGKSFTEERLIPSDVQEITAYDFVDSTDAVLTLSNGQQIYVRLIATGKLSDYSNPKQTQFAEVLIDISDPVLRTANRDVLREHITLSPEQRKWCSNQIDSSLQKELLMAAQRAADEHDQHMYAAQEKREHLIINRDDPREKLKRLREEFKRRHLESQIPDQEILTVPTWSNLKKRNTAFHAFKLRDEQNFWVLINSALHDGYFIVPSPELFDGWDEALPSSLGKPDYEKNAYIGNGDFLPVDKWFYTSKRLEASNIDSDSALTLKFTQTKSS